MVIPIRDTQTYLTIGVSGLYLLDNTRYVTAVDVRIRLGYQGTSVIVSCSTNFYVVTDLDDDMEYDFCVRAVCGSGWQSEDWSSTTATTLPYVVVCDAPTEVLPRCPATRPPSFGLPVKATLVSKLSMADVASPMVIVPFPRQCFAF